MKLEKAVSASRPFPNRAALAAAGFVLLLAGCGIKSNLEQPQARLAEPEAAAKTTAQETSRVQTGRMFNLLPPEEPLEWDKDKPKKNTTSTSKAGVKSTVPDKPFILDSLL
jgi:hypothetical protein